MGFYGFLTQRQGPLDFEVRYKSGIFWLVSERLTRRSPFTAFRLTAKLAAAKIAARIVPLMEAAIRNYCS